MNLLSQLASLDGNGWKNVEWKQRKSICEGKLYGNHKKIHENLSGKTWKIVIKSQQRKFSSTNRHSSTFPAKLRFCFFNSNRKIITSTSASLITIFLCFSCYACLFISVIVTFYNPPTPFFQFSSLDTPGYVGFANLPNQVHRKSVKKGFEFTLMIVGESGLGKSTLVNSLFLTDLYPERVVPDAIGEQSKTFQWFNQLKSWKIRRKTEANLETRRVNSWDRGTRREIEIDCCGHAGIRWRHRQLRQLRINSRIHRWTIRAILARWKRVEPTKHHR